MKVLLINKFFHRGSGADCSFFNTAELLRTNGHEVFYFSMRHPRNLPTEFEPFFVSNVDFNGGRSSGFLKTSLRVLYSFEARRKLEALLDRYKPDIAHLHNIYHQLSPSIIHTLRLRSIPAVMTLHDFKVVCPAYALAREARVCRECSRGHFYRCITHKCMKGSFSKSVLAAAETYLHRVILGTYRQVDIYIAPSLFLKETISRMGFRARVVHLENFSTAADGAAAYEGCEETIVCFGRLARGKGLETLLDAMRHVRGARLKIFGDGPLRVSLADYIAKNRLNNVVLLGNRAQDELFRQIKKARFVVFPSELPENNPLSVLESLSLGKPVIAARVGGVPELVRDGVNGYLFEPGDIRHLSSLINSLLQDKDKIARLGKNAVSLIRQRYTPERHYRRLLYIYREALTQKISTRKR